MSASALKSTIPGVGTSTTSTNHSILPMNAMAQKVVPGSESGSMKPLSGTGMSYVTLQPPSQPLSLVQDHRPSVYQTPPYVSGNSEKEPELDKMIPNGVEIIKTETDQSMSTTIKQTESNRNNNLSPDNPTQDVQKDTQVKEEMTPENLDLPASCPQIQNKVEEKAPVNNGSKESDTVPISTTMQSKISSHKPEDGSVKTESQKSKPVAQSMKIVDGSAVAQANNPPKAETKTTASSKTNKRKPRELKDLKIASVSGADGANKPKRKRVQTQHYQVMPEIALYGKNLNKPSSSKTADDKLIAFYKNEFMAVRNTEGSFYVCQAVQNIYKKSSKRVRVRWLSQDKNNGEIYSPDFYDSIDFDSIITSLNLNRIEKNEFQLTKIELLRTENILKRSIDVEAGVCERPDVTEEHPDGLDLSLYNHESQLRRSKDGNVDKQKNLRRIGKRRRSSSSEVEETEEKSNRSKKHSEKAVATSKGSSSRAERALNRNTKSETEATTSVASTSSTTSAGAAKNNNTDVAKSESKKTVKQQSNNNDATGVSKTKSRAFTQNTQQSSNKTAGRPKRTIAAAGIASTEEPAPRKKPRGRA